MLFLLRLLNLPRIIAACDFSSSSFKLKKGTLPLLKNRYLNLKTIELLNETPRELTPCSISHIFRCDFKVCLK